MDLRVLTPDSALADLVDAKIEFIESQKGCSDIGGTGAG
ncbi:hypothetical protein MicloDRAFT_00001900 [Microvirga lotononidis]|uniref:Uncharacterized protein n=1 Tax=Microvirga lotononidis TaxID=864069 RepID=I4Z4Q8_9HYPH|nr:hypothetical protein MicloDRAFT_00001900 [Microvirga lotononidis]